MTAREKLCSAEITEMNGKKVKHKEEFLFDNFSLSPLLIRCGFCWNCTRLLTTVPFHPHSSPSTYREIGLVWQIYSLLNNNTYNVIWKDFDSFELFDWWLFPIFYSILTFWRRHLLSGKIPSTATTSDIPMDRESLHYCKYDLTC